MKNEYSQLLFDVQKKSNITVNNVKDLKLLKEEIDYVLNVSIGYNTLRRMFGFLEKRVPNINTLNKIANYLGYSSYSNYKNHKSIYYDWYFQQNLLQIINNKKIEISHINEINKGISNENNIVCLGYFINYYIEKNDVTTIIFIFKHINFDRVNSTQLQKMGIVISLILSSLTEKKALKIYEALIPLDNFRNNVPLLNIDYLNLSSRYYKINQLIHKNNANSSDLFFSTLMFKYKEYYIDTINSHTEINKPKEFDSFHFTLKGRFYGTLLLLNKDNNEQIKKDITVECTKNKVSYFLIEIIPALIFIEEIKFLEKILNKYYEEVFEGELWSSETTNSIYLIGLANVNLFTNKLQNAKRNLDLIDLEKVEIGYYEYIKLFYYLTNLKISYKENDIMANKLTSKNLQKCILKTKFNRFSLELKKYTI
jgi:hypothetical protein